ncbi:molybdopterin molybdotransferase MoeA [Chitiniphilus eburneus]|uniref:Molybdopterin molybdenumtransferase n=1 Tax=Chitiniphilus eburneus TaxID=2571148 RepID=A0A4U0QCN9_9NEIS|nr:gephyrin-like molybdotransferase Glp [Chitiniphilus eburneus]TJZ79076.1 molybdopterin molybdotransferase MoeA [Chitiniphilus eburneus]
MLTVDLALEQLLAAARPLTDCETVPLTAARGRVLATPLTSSIDVPAFDNSAMDGYALHVPDFAAPPVEYPLTQRIAAGEVGIPLAPGQAARILTGAPIPPGANAVAMQEDCIAGAETVHVNVPPRRGQNIRLAGEDVARDHVVLATGLRLRAAELGLAAAIGVPALSVLRPLRVALLCTGNELVEPGTPLTPGKIYNSNRYMLRALLEDLGCIVTDYGIVADELDLTTRLLAEAAQDNDVVISTGGVSVGEEDHVRAALQTHEWLALWKIAMKPGKPFAFGRIGEADFIGLPGNPVSSFATFVLLVRPFLLARLGVYETLPHLWLPAGFSRNRAIPRREFLRVRIEHGLAVPYPNQSSGVLTSVVWADAFAVVPEHSVLVEGDPVRIFQLSLLDH